MAITVTELMESREGGRSVTLIYDVLGTADDAEARAALDAYAPSTHDGRYKDELFLRPRFVDEEDDDGSFWEGRVSYVPFERRAPETGDVIVSGRTGGGTEHVAISLETVAAYAAPGQTAPNFAGAIGVSRAGVEGVDIPVVTSEWDERWYLPTAYFTQRYRDLVEDLYGCVNSTMFRGKPPGEIMFMGWDWSYREDESDYEAHFHFARRRNRYDLTVGEITGISKRGWDVLWPLYREVRLYAATPNEVVVQVPRAVYIERVTHLVDFRILGIGS